jgi:hypothetical protein
MGFTSIGAVFRLRQPAERAIPAASSARSRGIK